MSKFVNPFEAVDHHTEWSAAATITEWINQIVKEEGLPFGPARVEKRGVDKKRPDCVLYDNPSCTKTALVIEFKQPYYDPFDEELKEAARQKAARLPRRRSRHCLARVTNSISTVFSQLAFLGV